MRRRVAALGLALAAVGCGGPQSALDPAGPGAAAIAQSWWVMFWGSVAIFLLTIGLALYAALRAPERRPRIAPMKLLIGLGLVFPTVTLVALLVYGVRLGQAVLPSRADRDVFVVDVRGHQWWWEIRYPGGPGGTVVHTANELHVPAGRPVHVRVSSEDVIHSFWVPQLGPKMDAKPGLVSTIRLEALRPGTFRGQCAEFCGAQHARMALLVHAHEPAELERRLAALVDAGEAVRRRTADAGGADAFERHCAECHGIDVRERGPAVGPNLGAVSERSILGAGTLPNEAGSLRRWLLDHQSLKPGNRMTIQAHLDPAVIDSIVRLLEGER